MHSTSLFYQPSSTIYWLGLCLALLASLPLAIGLGFVYVLLGIVIPIIYLSVLTVLCTGFLMGLWARAIARWTHNINKKSQLIIAVFTGTLMVWSHWVAYVLYVYEGMMPPFSAYLWALLESPLQVGTYVEALVEINAVGLWTIGRASADTSNVSGWPLGLVWLIESLLLWGAPIVGVFGAKVYPYSEKMGRWYPKYTFDDQFKIVHNGERLVADLEQGVLSTIEALGLGTATRYSRLHVYYLEGEREHYLEVEKVYVDSESKADYETVVPFYKIDTSIAKRLLERFDTHKDRFDVV